MINIWFGCIELGRQAGRQGRSNQGRRDQERAEDARITSYHKHH